MALFTRTKKEEFVPLTQEELDQVTGEMMQQRLQFKTDGENASWRHLDDLFTQLREYFMRYRKLVDDLLQLKRSMKGRSYDQTRQTKPEISRLAEEIDTAKAAAKGKLRYIGAAILNIEKIKQKKVGAKARELLEIIFVKMGPELDLTQKQIKTWLPKTGWFS